MLEGPDLVAAALEARAEVEALYVDRERWGESPTADLVAEAAARGVAVYGLEPEVLRLAAQSTTPQPLLATARFVPAALTDARFDGLVVVLHDVQDPGNAGTVIRSAEAAGACAVILSGHSVDPYNPKTLRATTGAIFRLPVILADVDEVLARLRRDHVPTWATVVHGGQDLLAADLRGAAAIVIGNEAAGLDASLVERCDGRLTIPMAAGESLNAGVAASLIAFVARWQSQGRIPLDAPPSLEKHD